MPREDHDLTNSKSSLQRAVEVLHLDLSEAIRLLREALPMIAADTEVIGHIRRFLKDHGCDI